MTVWQVETSPNIAKCLLVTNFPESPMTCYGTQNTVNPKVVYIQIPQTYECVISLGKRDFADSFLVKCLEMGRLSVIMKGLIRKKQECQSHRRRRDCKNRDQSDAIDGFEDGRVPWTKECSQPPEVGKSKEWIPSGSLQKEHNPINTLILVSKDYRPPELCDDKFS